MKYRNWILFGIIILASFLRLWNLSGVPVSLFGDELDVGYHAYSILKTGRDYSGNFLPLHFQSLAEWRTPLYLYSTVPTVWLFGISPLGVRIPAALFGIVGILGIFPLIREISRFEMSEKKSDLLALISAAVLALSPWHIQYSRAAFEVTQLLVFYLFGLYFFFRSINKSRGGKWLWVSVALLVATPLVYSTAKLFTPILLVVLAALWYKDILSISKKYLVWALVAGILLGAPTAYATLFSGGAQRFGYISVFTDPTRETEVGAKRELAAHVRGEVGLGLMPTTSDKFFYNKFTFWGSNILKNYFDSFSTQFLFVTGDLNLRHSIEGMGQFYKVEIIALLVGMVFFFSKFKNRKIKTFIALWIALGAIPSSITRDGGMHATRLIIMLPPLVFLIAYGIYSLTKMKRPYNYVLVFVYLVLFIVNFTFYQNAYWHENPWYSERWWHGGFQDAIESVMEMEEDYDDVLIGMSSEPAWIFFAGWSEFDPAVWQSVKPDKNWINHEKYGNITTIGKYYFGSPDGGLYDWGRSMDDKVLFMASEKDVGINLIREPERTPSDLNLIKSIAYPSGEPAFYIFSGR